MSDFPDSGAEVLAFDDDRIDGLLADLAEPARGRPPLWSRMVRAANALSSTPRRAALGTVWLFALAALVLVSLVRPTVSVQTSLGPGKAACGVDVFLYGHPDAAVANACRHAGSARGWLLLASLVVVLGGAAAGTLVLAQRQGPRPAARVLPALIAALGGFAFVVGALALRPAPVQLISRGTVVTARCGADAYFFGHPDPMIQSACRHAYSGQAHVLIGAIVVAAIVAAALGFRRLAGLGRRRDRTRLLAGMVAGLLALVGLVAFVPKTVSVAGGAAPVVASCGLDTFLAGHPDHTIQASCRSHYANRAALGT